VLSPGGVVTLPSGAMVFDPGGGLGLLSGGTLAIDADVTAERSRSAST
jgi:hypothetical protein